MSLWAAHSRQASAQLQTKPTAAGSASEPICFWQRWALRECGGAPPPPADFWPGTGKGQTPAAGMWLQMFPTGRSSTPLPAFRSCPWAPLCPLRLPPTRVRAVAPRGEERGRDPAGGFPLLSESLRAGAELPSGNTRQVGKARLPQCSEGLPAHPGAPPPSRAAQQQICPDQSPSRFSLVMGNGSWGEQEERTIIYGAAPNTAADSDFCSGDFLSFLWFFSVGSPP